jgi:hypothetical protein
MMYLSILKGLGKTGKQEVKDLNRGSAFAVSLKKARWAMG